MAIMKILLLIILITLSRFTLAESIENTYWVNTGGDYECQFFIRFNVNSYIVFNDCYAEKQDGIVESGHYKIQGETILFSNRNPNIKINLFNNSQPKITVAFIAKKSNLTLILDENSYNFKAVNDDY